jgi:hypothetical protein
MTDDLITRLRAAVPSIYDCIDAADALKAKDRRIEELEKMLALSLAVDVDALKARIGALEAALLPFAAIADESTANLADNYMYPDCYPMSAFRAAKVALENK